MPKDFEIFTHVLRDGCSTCRPLSSIMEWCRSQLVDLSVFILRCRSSSTSDDSDFKTFCVGGRESWDQVLVAKNRILFLVTFYNNKKLVTKNPRSHLEIGHAMSGTEIGHACHTESILCHS